jgi:membrane protease YdiL (CAAX protease family)
MINFIKQKMQSKNHKSEDITAEILYKNRVSKSVFFVLIMIFSFSLNALFIYLNLKYNFNGTIAVNILQFYFITAAILGFIFLPYHGKHYGINLYGLKFNILSGLLIGILGLIISLNLRIYMFNSGIKEFGFYFDPFIFCVRFVFYLLFSISQELVTKGYFQSYFVAVFDNVKFKKVYSILLASLVFSQFHILYGLWLVAGTFLYSVITGFYYEKTRSILGVSIIHFLTGSAIFFFSSAY